jgi:DNA-binding transcriptional LysR family regulator
MHAMNEWNLRSVDLNLLVVFDALMIERNVTRVAERLSLSQPAVSKALGRLRHLFTDPLFVRHDRAMEPTSRARALAGPIHTALRDITHTLSIASFDPGVYEGQIRIASIDVYHTPLIPELVRSVRALAPGLDLHVRALDCARVRDQLACGEVSLALSPFDAHTAGFHSLPLWADQLVTLTSRSLGPRRLSLEAFAASAHVVDAGHVHIAEDGTASSVVDALLGARGLKRRIAMVLPAAAGLPFIVASTDLIATVPGRIASGLAAMGDVNLIPCPLDVQVTPHMIWHARTNDDPLLGWLRSLVTEIAHKPADFRPAPVQPATFEKLLG